MIWTDILRSRRHQRGLDQRETLWAMIDELPDISAATDVETLAKVDELLAATGIEPEEFDRRISKVRELRRLEAEASPLSKLQKQAKKAEELCTAHDRVEREARAAARAKGRPLYEERDRVNAKLAAARCAADAATRVRAEIDNVRNGELAEKLEPRDTGPGGAEALSDKAVEDARARFAQATRAHAERAADLARLEDAGSLNGVSHSDWQELRDREEEAVARLKEEVERSEAILARVGGVG